MRTTNKTSTGESRRDSQEKQEAARAQRELQRVLTEDISRMMQQLERLGTSGFTDTDELLMEGVQQMSESAGDAAEDEAAHTETTAAALAEHAEKMAELRVQAEDAGREADASRPSDARISGGDQLSEAYRRAETMAAELMEDGSRSAGEVRSDSASDLRRLNEDIKKRPSLRL